MVPIVLIQKNQDNNLLLKRIVDHRITQTDIVQEDLPSAEYRQFLEEYRLGAYANEHVEPVLIDGEQWVYPSVPVHSGAWGDDVVGLADLSPKVPAGEPPASIPRQDHERSGADDSVQPKPEDPAAND